MLENKKVVVFDWDGTLANSVSQKVEAYVTAMLFYLIKSQAISPKEDLESHSDRLRHFYYDQAGIPRGLIIQKFFSAWNLFYDETDANILAETISNIYLNCASSVGLHDDVETVIEHLVKLTKKIYISSASPSAELLEVTSMVLSKALLAKVEAIFGSDGKFHKGSPHFDEILRLEKISRSQLLFVGDDVHDQIIAEDYDIDFLRILRRNTRPMPFMATPNHLESLKELIHSE